TTTETPIPGLPTAAVADAMRFHTDLDAAEQQRTASATMTHAIVGCRQPTPTTARITNGRVELLDTYQGQRLDGDATVPLVGAARAATPLASNTLRRIVDKHGNLQRNKAALDELESILTAAPLIPRATAPIDPQVTVPELILAGAPLPVEITLAEPGR